MSEDDKKDFQNNPLYDPSEPLAEEELEDLIEHFREELKIPSIISMARGIIKPLADMQPPEPDSPIPNLNTLPLNSNLSVVPNLMPEYYMNLENEINRLNSDVKHLKTIIFKLEIEIQALKNSLKNNKEE